MILFFLWLFLMEISLSRSLFLFIFCPRPIQFLLLSKSSCSHLLSLFLSVSFPTIQSLLSVLQLLPQANSPNWILGPSLSTAHLGVSRQGPSGGGCWQGLPTCFRLNASWMQAALEAIRKVLGESCTVLVINAVQALAFQFLIQ